MNTRRIGLLGWSMGGVGALHVSQLLGPSRVAAAAVMSPAIWHRYADTAPGAYDDGDDFARVNPLGKHDAWRGIRLCVDCGRNDPFVDATRDFVGGFDERPEGGFQRGDHDVGYWRRTAPAQLAFLGRAFAARALSA